MLQAEIGDQLVRSGTAIEQGEILGVVTQVHGEDGGPPFTVRWYDDWYASKVNPNPERFWIRSQVDVHEMGIATRRGHQVV